jgi:iron complex outermembrane receptor protein
MKNSVKIISIIGLALGFSLGGVSWAFAQDQESDEFTLEEVTVTAEKREQNVQKVAIPIETISGYELTEMGSLDLDDALRNVSSALVAPAGEEMTVIIRGMDNDSMPGDSFSQVAVTVDGSFSNSWGVGTTGLYDMQRVEVLSGPQGTLYSRNSSGGVINMISNDPQAEEYEGSGSVEIGNYNLVNTQGMVNAPITKTLAVRAAFISTVRDGYSDNGLNDADDRSLRLKLKYNPSESLSAVVTYEYAKIGGKSQGDGYAAFEDEDDVDDPWHGNSDGDLFVSNTQTDRFYMNLDWATPIGDLTFLPSYSDTSRHNIQAGWLWSNGDFGMMTMDPTATHVGQGREHFLSPQDEQSYELRMASKEDAFFIWVAGLYYYEQNWDDLIYHEAAVWINDQGTEDTSDDETVSYSSTEETANWGSKGSSSKAAFGNLTYPVIDAFRVTAGGRYTEEEETSEGTDMMSGEPTSSEDDSNHFDYKAGFEYDLNENTLLWLDHSTGYKQVRGSSADQELKSYQVGYKSRLFNNNVQLNATAFYYDYSNFDIGRVESEYLVVDSENVEYQGQGIGDANLYGLDVSSDFILTSRDRLNFSLSYLSAEVDEVIITYTNRDTQEESPLVPPKSVDAGKPLNNAPEWSIVGSYEHRFSLPDGSGLTPSLNVRYTSEYYCEFYPDDSNLAEGLDVEEVNTEPAKIMADASLNYRHASGNWSFNAYIKNITDHAEKNGFMRGDLRLGSPRTYGGVLSIRF